jgi:cell wall-associated protease
VILTTLGSAAAQTPGALLGRPPHDWTFRNPQTDSLVGIDLYRAYDLLKRRPYRTVVVAVIDNGFDINHEDLKDVIWTNPKEIPGNNIDDDHNGYVDDVHGWNFRSAPDGTPADNDQLESTRIYAHWKSKYEGVDSTRLSAGERKRMRVYREAKRDYLNNVAAGPDSTALRYDYNLNYDASQIIRDHPDDLSEHSYGSPFMNLTPALIHGTVVAGVIAANRTNDLGIAGVADHVMIMPIVATTATGDERDKDIANAIRYAVDNGARVISMSFGKRFSPGKSVVDDAVRYAERKNVLLVHSAGNEGEDYESYPKYPNGSYLTGGKAKNVITVGWSRWKFDERLAHPYSNYGKRSVDIFAPGSDVYSTLPHNLYGSESGSSLSAPLVSGVAALLMSYFPRLSAVQVKDIILRSAFKPEISVNRPGSTEKVPFRTLSVSGGILNAYNAVSMASSASTRR